MHSEPGHQPFAAPAHTEPPRRWFDAHLDLAYLAINGRDMLAPLRPDLPPHPPAGVTLPALRTAGVRACLATIYTQAVAPGQQGAGVAERYRADDTDDAHRAGLQQLATYEAWANAGWITLLGAAPGGPLHVALLMEGADPIRGVDELAWWRARGVLVIGLTWALGSRYAAGNAAPALDGSAGLTASGRDLVDAIDGLGMVHDISHLSFRATDQLLARARGLVIASHSNCGGLVDVNNPRHLRDDVIRELGRRRSLGLGGVIGLNLYSPFLVPREQASAGPARATIGDAIAHVARIVELQGDALGVGLGSDIDGGFGADRLPMGIDSVLDIARLEPELREIGLDERAIEAFCWGNWERALSWHGGGGGRTRTAQP